MIEFNKLKDLDRKRHFNHISDLIAERAHLLHNQALHACGRFAKRQETYVNRMKGIICMRTSILQNATEFCGEMAEADEL